MKNIFQKTKQTYIKYFPKLKQTPKNLENIFLGANKRNLNSFMVYTTLGT